ncbi:hypothetical protein CDL15_Pgr004804 [Punica granatum]|uniref:Uncharacterized protein n=1 Tax=Punica granatum TaxID=22663 RepID=A0A218W8A0_PUNGR|nr:hypothetical protein CDL15_Pgr004804 [Punica granatum]
MNRVKSGKQWQPEPRNDGTIGSEEHHHYYEFKALRLPPMGLVPPSPLATMARGDACGGNQYKLPHGGLGPMRQPLSLF